MEKLKQRIELIAQRVDELELSGGSGGDSYTKAEINNMLALKSDKSNTYTKEQTNHEIDEVFGIENFSGTTLPNSYSDILRLHKPIMVNNEMLYFLEENANGYIYFELDNSDDSVIYKLYRIDKSSRIIYEWLTKEKGSGLDDLTEEQLAALNSGITSAKVTQIDTNTTAIDNKQNLITSTNKLNSDLINDTNQNNKFVTSAEKTKIANALTEEVYNAGKQVKTGDNIGEIFNDYSGNKATGNYSHAEGYGTTASERYSHAEGSSTTASGASSHAENVNTKALGDYSHAEGYGTTASGNTSHAEGSLTAANANYSHAEGYNTRARSMYQHVQGKYNIEDSNSKYAFIIGNGTTNENRSNAFAVDWEGKIYINNSNKGTDVSAHDNALVELVNGGAKNLLKNEGTTTSTATVNSDGTILINGTNPSTINIALSTTTKLPAGDYVLSTENIASNVYLTARVASNIQYTCTGNTKSVSFTLDEETTLERVYLFINANTSIDNLKLTPMICSKAAWDISQNYVPYRPSYDELVARIEALENA